MADPLSIAASALAVAGGGGKLAQTLYTFIESFRKSEKQLKPVADHVKLTSAVLNNVGSLLGDEDVRQLCKDSLLDTTNDALEGCKKAFDELRQFTDAILKTDSKGKVRLGAFDKLTFIPFRSREFDGLQANLERFKSALDLILSVLTLGVSIRRNKDAAEIQQLKLQVEKLIKAKAEAEHVASMIQSHRPDSTSHQTRSRENDEQALSAQKDAPTASLPTSGAARVVSAAEASSLLASSTFATLQPEPANVSMGMNGPMYNLLSAVPHLPLHPKSRNDNRTGAGAEPRLPARIRSSRVGGTQASDWQSEVSDRLEMCADAVSALSASMEQVISRWEARRRYNRRELTPAFLTVFEVMKRLWTLGLHLELIEDSDSEDSATEGILSPNRLRSRSRARTESSQPPLGEVPASTGSCANISFLHGDILPVQQTPLLSHSNLNYDHPPVSPSLDRLGPADPSPQDTTYTGQEAWSKPQSRLDPGPADHRSDGLENTKDDVRSGKRDIRVMPLYESYLKGPTSDTAHFLHPYFSPRCWMPDDEQDHYTEADDDSNHDMDSQYAVAGSDDELSMASAFASVDSFPVVESLGVPQDAKELPTRPGDDAVEQERFVIVDDLLKQWTTVEVT